MFITKEKKSMYLALSTLLCLSVHISREKLVKK